MLPGMLSVRKAKRRQELILFKKSELFQVLRPGSKASISGYYICMHIYRERRYSIGILWAGKLFKHL